MVKQTIWITVFLVLCSMESHAVQCKLLLPEDIAPKTRGLHGAIGIYNKGGLLAEEQLLILRGFSSVTGKWEKHIRLIPTLKSYSFDLYLRLLQKDKGINLIQHIRDSIVAFHPGYQFDFRSINISDKQVRMDSEYPFLIIRTGDITAWIGNKNVPKNGVRFYRWPASIPSDSLPESDGGLYMRMSAYKSGADLFGVLMLRALATEPLQLLLVTR